MKRYSRTHRTTYAANHRMSAPRSGVTIYHTQAGEGILKQTCSGAEQGFDAPIVERQRANGTPIYFVNSETFQDRYYFLYQQRDGAWVFSGDSGLLLDAKQKDVYILRVQAFIASQDRTVGQEVA
jgi:hypothetical protein